MLSTSVAEWDGLVAEFECCFFVCWFDKNRWPNGTNSMAEFANKKYNRNVFLGPDLFQFFEDSFTINIGFVSKQTLR